MTTKASSDGYCYPYPRPALTADVVLLSLSDGACHTLLIRRAKEPMQGQWALPGGFVDEMEPLVQAACRELAEETSIRVKPAQLHQFGAYGDPGRDPRGWTVSVAFYAVVDAKNNVPVAADDAKQVEWKPLHRPPKLAFDHRKIIKDVIARVRDDVFLRPILKPFAGTSAYPIQQWAEWAVQLTGTGDASVYAKKWQDCGLLEKVPDARPALWKYAKCR